MQAEQQIERQEVIARITAYLSGGGLFNPELANHTAVRDLLIDCRAALSHPSTPQGWKDMAYAKLGFVRDRMTPEHVDAVQRFLRDEYTAPPEQGGRNA